MYRLFSTEWCGGFFFECVTLLFFFAKITMLKRHPEFEEFATPGMNSQGQPKRARIKMRLSGKGKFIHRNRYRRVNVICCLHGELDWLFIDSFGGMADETIASITNDNWNGFRSQKYPTTLSREEMEKLAAECMARGIEAFVVRRVFCLPPPRSLSNFSQTINLIVKMIPGSSEGWRRHDFRRALVARDIVPCPRSQSLLDPREGYGSGRSRTSSQNEDASPGESQNCCHQPGLLFFLEINNSSFFSGQVCPLGG